MVTTNQDGGEGEMDLEAKLQQAWSGMLSSQQSAATFLAESQKKDMGGNLGQVAFFNNKLVSSRPVIKVIFF